MNADKTFTSAFAREVHKLNRRECRDCGRRFTPEDPAYWQCPDCYEADNPDDRLDELDFDGYPGYDDGWK